MSKTVFVEESLKKYIQELAPSSGYILGLILGQRSAQRDYVIHLPAFRNLQPKSGDDETEVSKVQAVKSVQEINTKNFIDYSKQVTAFLSGGMWVLGIFSSGPEDGGLLDPSQAPKLQTFMNSLFTKLAADPLLYGTNTLAPEKLVMHFNSSTNKATCKSVNLSDTKFYLSNTDWKFQSQPIEWQEVESRFAFDFKIPVKENNGVTSLKTNLERLLQEQAATLKDAHCFLQGEVQNIGATLESIKEGAGAGDEQSNESSIFAELQIECTGDPDAEVEYLKCSGDLVMSGHVYSRVYMQPKASVGEAVLALKEDIVRSLRTRFELHTDALIEEEEGSPEERVVQHDLPRRILVPLPCSQVKLSNYLFPGESASDSMASVQQLLGFQVDEDYVEEGLEEEAGPELVGPFCAILSDVPVLKPTEQLRAQTPQPTTEQSSTTWYLALAFLVLCFALCTTLFFIKDVDEPAAASSKATTS